MAPGSARGAGQDRPQGLSNINPWLPTIVFKATNVPRAHPDARIFRIDLGASSAKVPKTQTAWWGWGHGVGSGRCRGPARWTCGGHPRRFVAGVQMRCRECAAEVAVTARVCSRCGVPIVGQPTVVGAVIRRLRESYEGTNVAGVVLMCASALVGIFFILGSVWLYVDNRDLAAHGVRTQGQVVDADADGSDEVVYTVDGTDYQVPGPEVGDRLPGDAVTVVYDPRDPSNSNLEDDSARVALALGLPRGWAVFSGVARDACRRGGLRSRRTGRPQAGEGASRATPTGDAAHATGRHGGRYG